MLRAEKIEIHLPALAVRADFSVKSDERLAITGLSGCGKSTLLRSILGFQKIAGGRWLLGEQDLGRLAIEKREIGWIAQDPALFPSLNVLENAAFGLRMRSVDRSEREALVRPWLKKVGLEALEKRGVERLSGGERQRVAFVRAMVWRPKLLLLDEPFSALDSSLRGKLRDELLQLHGENPVPLVLVTHDRDDVAALATFEIAGHVEHGVSRCVVFQRQ